MSVSVVIPVYNQSRFIGEAIESILNQTVKVDEIIVVDDGSTDNLNSVLAPFNGLIKLIKFHPNLGVSIARNVGVNHAKNSIILFQDADDVSLPGRVELCVNALADEKINIVQGMVDQFSDESMISEGMDARIDYGVPSHQMSTCVLAFKKEVFIRTGEFDPELNEGGEDLEWIMRAMKKGYRLTKIDQIFIRKRNHENNTSILKLEDEAKIRLKIFRKNFAKK